MPDQAMIQSNNSQQSLAFQLQALVSGLFSSPRATDSVPGEGHTPALTHFPNRAICEDV